MSIMPFYQKWKVGQSVFVLFVFNYYLKSKSNPEVKITLNQILTFHLLQRSVFLNSTCISVLLIVLSHEKLNIQSWRNYGYTLLVRTRFKEDRCPLNATETTQWTPFTKRSPASTVQNIICVVLLSYSLAAWL